MNGISKGMEVNTAEMLYKSIVRSIFDYGSSIFFPRHEGARKKLERAQLKGIRAALGYRISTPANIILEESKIESLRERTVMLTENLLLKKMIWGEEETVEKIKCMERKEAAVKTRQPRKKVSVISEAWRRVYKERGRIKRNRGYDLFEEEY